MEAKLDWEFFAIVVQRDDPALIEREGLWQNGGRLHLRDRAKEHVQVQACPLHARIGHRTRMSSISTLISVSLSLRQTFNVKSLLPSSLVHNGRSRYQNLELDADGYTSTRSQARSGSGVRVRP